MNKAIKMTIKNTSEQYGSVAKFLHWAMGLLIITMLIIGYFMGDWGSATIYNIHKLTGLSILVLAIFRVFWSIANRRPRLPSDVNRLEKFLARCVQVLLYLCMFVMPLSGWAMTTASGRYPHIGSNVFPMPGIPTSQTLARTLFEIHSTAALLLIGLISLHVLGALKHHFIDKDTVLKKILPGFYSLKK